MIATEEWSQPERRTVSDVIATDPEYIRAITTALGESGGYLVVSSFQDAARGMQLLEDGMKGRATFICLNRLPEYHLRDIPAEESNIIGRASELCRSEQKYESLRRALLGNTVVVRSVEEAVRVTEGGLAEQAVTLDGVLVRAGGVVRGGGSRQKEESAIIGRKEQVEVLGREVVERTEQLAKMRSEIATLQSRHDEIDLGRLSDEVRQAQHSVGILEKRLAQAEYEKEYAEDLLVQHEEEGERGVKELSKMEAVLDSITPRREGLLQEKNALEEQAVALGEELEAYEASYAALNAEMNSRRIVLVELQAEEKNAHQELERIKRDREAAEGTIRRAETEVREAEEGIEHLTGSVGELEERRVEFQKELEEAREEHRKISEAQAAKREEIAKHANTLREERKGYEDSVELAHELEIKIGELNAKAESLATRALEELELELQRKEFDHETSTPLGELRERLREVKGKIKMLGNVNLLAYEEWQTEKERFEFLRDQVEDLTKAETDLVRTINEINETAQRQFLDTFEQIRGNFRRLFQSLFHEGDEADLLIEEGADDLLEARVE
ncbi:MAG: hypothetical protein AB7H80_17790, partial [Candidatus Kapaibacterium sp.]